MQRNCRHSSRCQRGLVLVEMVLITPLMLLLMLATAEVSRAFVDHNTLTKAARNGVRGLELASKLEQDVCSIKRQALDDVALGVCGKAGYDAI